MTQQTEVSHSAGNTRVNGRILLAEDDLVSQSVTAAMLERAGYQVTVVSDGHSAVRALESDDYDLVLMDCSMPGMNGFEATQAIRLGQSYTINPEIPIIALTGFEQLDDLEKCRAAGMDGHVNKPADPNLLIAMIERHLQRQGDKGESPAQFEPCRAGVTPGNTEAAKQEHQARDSDFMGSIIDLFLENVPQEVADLQAALERGDVSQMQDIGHRLRGSAAILKASTLTARASALEQAGKSGDSVLAARLTQELITELQTLSAALSAD